MELHERLNVAQWVALVAGLAGVGALLLLALLAGLEAAPLYRAYLVVFLYWNGLSVGCLGWLLLHNLTGGNWGFAVQRLLAAGARTLPLMALLFLPLLVGLSFVYPWATDPAAATDYFNQTFFVARALFYFAVWSTLAILLPRWSYRSDHIDDPDLWQHVIRLSAAGTVFYILTATFAAFDWLMSLEPAWFSSIFGWLAIGRHGLGAIAFALLLLGLVGRRAPVARLVGPRLLNDLGNLLLVTLLTWAYLALMQYLVIWSANIPEEVVWYERRNQMGWEWVALVLVALYLALPALLLLLRPIKQRLFAVVALAALILILRLLHIYWLVAPAFNAGLSFYWPSLLLLLAVGGLWLALFFWQLKNHALLPFNHPRLQEALAEHEGVI